MPKGPGSRLILAAFAASLLVAGAVQAALPTVNIDIATGVIAIDTSENGTVDRGEWKAAGTRTFDIIDRNHDGIVSEEEFTMIHAVTFSIIDKDRDGVLTAKELDAYKQLPWTLGWR